MTTCVNMNQSKKCWGRKSKHTVLFYLHEAEKHTTANILFHDIFVYVAELKRRKGTISTIKFFL